jgi:hypothetical protein
VRLLGPSEPPSLVRFNEAVRALCERADERRARMESRTGSDIPAPRGAAEEAPEEMAIEADAAGTEDSVTA